MSTLYTIGYEGAALGDFIATLHAAQIKHVMDIREVPQSRRPGFSKNVLAAALASEGIDYSHWKQLGDPKAGREAARQGRMEEFRSIFESHLALPQSQAALSDASKEVMRQATVLLCFERDPRGCHRTLVAHRLIDLCSLSVRHLGVVEHGAKQRKFAEAA
jgi:uncharacterized protein (DUF488 family)